MHAKEDLSILHPVVSSKSIQADGLKKDVFLMVFSSSYLPGFFSAPHPQETFSGMGENSAAVAGVEKQAVTHPSGSCCCLPDQPTNQWGHAARF